MRTMRFLSTMSAAAAALALACAACGSGTADEAARSSTEPTGTPAPASPTGSEGGGAAPPLSTPVSGAFQGSYEVPVPAELAQAAVYQVDELDWIVRNGQATLSYKLPRALVGKSINVDFTGPFDPDARELMLVGKAGTATCTIASGAVRCHEIMRGLLPIDPDYEEIAELARETYAGPAQHRIDVAKRFAGDPIGIAHIDLAKPVSEVEAD